MQVPGRACFVRLTVSSWHKRKIIIHWVSKQTVSMNQPWHACKLSPRRSGHRTLHSSPCWAIPNSSLRSRRQLAWRHTWRRNSRLRFGHVSQCRAEGFLFLPLANVCKHCSSGKRVCFCEYERWCWLSGITTYNISLKLCMLQERKLNNFTAPVQCFCERDPFV